MKKLFSLAIVLLSGTCSFAQENTGTILYEEVLKMPVDINKGVPEGLAALLPSERKVRKLLSYTETASLYENDVANTEDMSKSFESGGAHIQIRTSVPEEKVYTSYADKKVIQQRDFMDRKFLIRSGFTYNWKMTGRQKKILDYSCNEAIGISGEDTVTAWYTTAIPLSTGPDGLAGLPGLILEASFHKDKTVRAVSVKTGTPARTIKEPKGGKSVTAKEYEAIVKKRIEEFHKEHGGSGNVIIQTHTETHTESR